MVFKKWLLAYNRFVGQFPVTPAKETELQKQMAKYNIKEVDFVERFVLGSGPGGQKVNKTASCVLLMHIPTGILVKCQKTRSQSLNRFHARRILVEKIASQVEGQKSDEQHRREKIRRQKRRRSQRAKQKILEQKRQQSQKKQLRKPPQRNSS